MATVEEVVYLGRDNIFAITVTEGGALVDFTAATSYQLTVNEVTHTSGMTGDDSGVITFDIGDIAVGQGKHRAHLVVIDPTHPLGQVVVDEHSENPLEITFVAA